MIETAFVAVTFFFCYTYGSYLDLKKGLIYDIIPLTGFLLVFTFWTQNVFNMFALTCTGLVLYSFDLMGWADIEYILLSAATLYFVDVFALLLGMGMSVWIYMETMRKLNKEKIKLIPALYAGTILSYFLNLL